MAPVRWDLDRGPAVCRDQAEGAGGSAGGLDGLEAYQARKESKPGVYSYERRSVNLEEPHNGLLQKKEAAWSFFQRQP